MNEYGTEEKMKYYNLTTPQKNIWNLLKYYEGTSIGNQCEAIFYNEKRDINLLKKALKEVIASQKGLQLRFREETEAVQYACNEISDIHGKWQIEYAAKMN